MENKGEFGEFLTEVSSMPVMLILFILFLTTTMLIASNKGPNELGIVVEKSEKSYMNSLLISFLDSEIEGKKVYELIKNEDNKEILQNKIKEFITPTSDRCKIIEIGYNIPVKEVMFETDSRKNSINFQDGFLNKGVSITIPNSVKVRLYSGECK